MGFFWLNGARSLQIKHEDSSAQLSLDCFSMAEHQGIRNVKEAKILCLEQQSQKEEQVLLLAV